MAAQKALDPRIGVVRQLQQSGRLLGEGLAHAQCLLLWARPVRRHSGAPGRGLGIEVVHIGKPAGRKEAVAYVAHRAFDFTFFVAACHRHWAGLVAIVRREVEQRRVEADGITLTLQHGAFEIVVEQDPWTALPRDEGFDMSAQEAFQACIEEEAQEDPARVAQHHDEGHQRPAGVPNGEMTEVPPVNLPLLAWKTAQAQIGFGRPPRTVTGDEVAEVIAASSIAALAHHGVQAAGRERREFAQGLEDERQVGLDLRASCRRTGSRQTGLGQHPRHGAMVHVQLAGDGTNAPFLDVIVAQDLCLELRQDGHDALLDVWS